MLGYPRYLRLLGYTQNDQWHGYAAMAAAAYAKDLLRRIVLNKVEAEKKISEVLSG